MVAGEFYQQILDERDRQRTEWHPPMREGLMPYRYDAEHDAKHNDFEWLEIINRYTSDLQNAVLNLRKAETVKWGNSNKEKVNDATEVLKNKRVELASLLFAWNDAKPYTYKGENKQYKNSITPQMSERAKRAFSNAGDESRKFGHWHIDAEHLLLGLIAETEGVAARVLNEIKHLSVLRGELKFIIEKEKYSTDEVGFTETLKEIIDLSKEETKAMNHSYMGTEHLLVGIILHEDNLAARVLDSCDVHLDDVRREIHKILSYN